MIGMIFVEILNPAKSTTCQNVNRERFTKIANRLPLYGMVLCQFDMSH
jgi:hypothetical protein